MRIRWATVTAAFFIPAWAALRYLRWSPDGQAIDYADTRQGVSNIWAQPLSDGPPRQITEFRTGYIYNFAWSRSGDLALALGTATSDAVLIKNF